MVKYGDMIANLREKQNLTQEQLANKVGISRASLSHYEKNRREPDYHTLQKFADYFEVTIDYLLGRSEFPELNKLESNFLNNPNTDTNELEKVGVVFLIDGKKPTPEEIEEAIAYIKFKRQMKEGGSKN